MTNPIRYKVRFIRCVPGMHYRVGDVVETLTGWWFVEAGYAVPLNFEWDFDPVKAAKMRRKIEDDYKAKEVARSKKNLLRAAKEKRSLAAERRKRRIYSSNADGKGVA